MNFSLVNPPLQYLSFFNFLKKKYKRKKDKKKKKEDDERNRRGKKNSKNKIRSILLLMFHRYIDTKKENTQKTHNLHAPECSSAFFFKKERREGYYHLGDMMSITSFSTLRVLFVLAFQL